MILKRESKIVLFFLLFICWSCQQNDIPLSDELISSNLSKKGKSDPEFLIGEWKIFEFAYTKDGGRIKTVDAFSSTNEVWREINILNYPSEFFTPSGYYEYVLFCH